VPIDSSLLPSSLPSSETAEKRQKRELARTCYDLHGHAVECQGRALLAIIWPRALSHLTSVIAGLGAEIRPV